MPAITTPQISANIESDSSRFIPLEDGEGEAVALAAEPVVVCEVAAGEDGELVVESD